jgi:PAS domain-containing protein
MYDHLYEVTIAELQSEIDDLKKENKTLSGRYHRLENYLKEHQARNHSLFFTNESVKCIISPFSGNIMSCNQEAVRFYGYPQEEMLRMKIFDISILAEPQIQKDLVRARNGWQKVFHDKHRLPWYLGPFYDHL